MSILGWSVDAHVSGGPSAQHTQKKKRKERKPTAQAGASVGCISHTRAGQTADAPIPSASQPAPPPLPFRKSPGGRQEKAARQPGKTGEGRQAFLALGCLADWLAGSDGPSSAQQLRQINLTLTLHLD